MQKTEKPPKRAESERDGSIAESAQLKKLDLTFASPDTFKAQLLSTIRQSVELADKTRNLKLSESLGQQLTGVEYCFDKLHIEGEQLINISQGALASLERAGHELEKDPQTRQEPAIKAELEALLQSLQGLHQWLREYQSSQGQGKKLPPPVSPPGQTTPPYSDKLQQLIAALNVSTVGAFLNALKTLNQFLDANPTITVSLQQFYGLFDQLDQTFQRLPESFGQGLSQRQTIASMIAINRQVNQLYGFLMGRQIV